MSTEKQQPKKRQTTEQSTKREQITMNIVRNIGTSMIKKNDLIVHESMRAHT